MSNGAFLLIAVGLSIVGSLLIWLFNRKPKTFMSSIDDFSREMKALGRETDAPAPGRRWKRTALPPDRGPTDQFTGPQPADDAPDGDGELEEIDLDAQPDEVWSNDPTEERRS